MKRALIAVLALGLIIFLIGCPPPAPDTGPADDGNGTEMTNGAEEMPEANGDMTDGEMDDEGMDEEGMDDEGQDDAMDGADDTEDEAADDAAG